MGAAERYLNYSWEAQNKVKLKSLEPYRPLFPKPTGIDKTINSNANVSHTVKFIPQVVKSCGWQVEKFVEQELRGLSLYEACKKLWEFVRYHIEWVRDKQFKEQVRSPRRLIWDGKGDCDCGTTFVNTCMYVYGARNITSRITAYDGNENFSHIYSVIPNPSGGEIIIDFCVHKFDYEKPYSKKQDYNMELQFLDGIPQSSEPKQATINELFSGSDLGELGRLLKRRASGGGSAAAPKKPGLLKKAVQKVVPQRSPEKKAAAQEKRKATGKKALKVVNKINKINPATVLLRAGILASMKLNVGKVAEKIKWGYATREYAAAKGMDMTKYDKVKAVLAKTEQIFFAAGGNAQNLKKAILTGLGNRNREVSGFDGLTDGTPLPQLLGAVFQDEFVSGMEGFKGVGLEGFGELGEPATAASIAAASTAMGTLAALLKSIGDLFPNKGKEKPVREKKQIFRRKQSPEAAASEQSIPSEEAVSTEESSPEEGSNEESESSPNEEEAPEESPTDENTDANMEVSPSEDVPAEESNETEEGTSGILSGFGTGLSGFYQKNKTWIVPVGIAGGCLLLAGGLYYLTRAKPQSKITGSLNPALNGPGRMRKRTRRKFKQQPNHQTKKVLALM